MPTPGAHSTDPATTPTPAPEPREAFDALSPDALLDRYQSGIARFDRRLLDLDDDALDTFFRPAAGVGRWSCRVLVGHLADAELVFTHRFRRTAAEDGPILPGWDEDAFIDAGLYSTSTPVAAFIALIHTIRTFTAQWLNTLDDAAWQRPALRGELGERTLRGLVVDATWHLEHHRWFLDRKLERLIGPAPAVPGSR